MSSTCMQGGIPRPLGGYQPNMMMEPSSPASAWQFHSVIPKQEPMDHEERNDSGINSGSDFHSSSPGSDHSENIPYTSPSSSSQMTHPIHQSNYCSTPVARMNQPSAIMYHQQQPVYNDHNPLTPPCSEPMASPKSHGNQNSTSATHAEKSGATEQHNVTPCASPSTANQSQPQPLTDNVHTDNPLRRLQMALEKNGLLSSPLSPKPSEYSGEDENKSDNDGDEYDEQELRAPKVNSHGKVKTFKCKQCDFIAITKLDFWDHTRSHIKADKLLTCPQCPFVTEYKHHLEYHLRNHFGSKPFKCTQCKYSCVNKSMLNSHLKSHSNIYQYRCSDCSYATKYCHSLKLHLRKYAHKPAMVLNPDGTPNPLPIIDVYGTRRGPKVKNQEQKSLEEPKPEQVLPFPLNQIMFNSPQMQLPFPGFPFFPGFSGALPNPLLLHNLEKIAKGQAGFLPSQESIAEESSESSQPDTEVLDLSKPEESVQKSRRKGRAFKLTPTHDNSSDDEEETTMFSNVEVVEEREQTPREETTEMKSEEETLNNNNKEDFSCQYCSINFGDAVLYTMHMGYHGYKNPFTCNMCGEECKDKVSFFLHIARTPHS